MPPNEVFAPRLAQYVASLPQGLTSHPFAVTKADFSLILRRQLAPHLADAQLSDAERSALTAPWQAGAWIPMTSYVALCAVARDVLWTSDEAYHDGMVEVAAEMYKGPVYRTLFAMFGPSLVAMGAAKRWHALHQGTVLAVKKQHKESVELLLTYPEKLIPEDGVRSLGAAFCAIALVSRAKAASFTLAGFGATSTKLTIHWTYW